METKLSFSLATLCMLYLTALLVSILIVYKTMYIGPIVISISLFTMPLTYCIGDIVAEVYGYNVAKKMIWLSIICELLFVLVANLSDHFSLTRSSGETSTLLLRASLANVIPYFFSEILNASIISKWKIIAQGRYFWIRNIASCAIAHFLYIIFAAFVAFYGLLPFKDIVGLIIITYIAILIFTCILCYPATILMTYIKKINNIDVYDYQISYNPFKNILG